jgi:putative proteasome-type protease
LTYCVGIKLHAGLVMGSDSRTHAEVDNFATFCKMTVFEQPGERVLVMLSSGSLAGTQAVVTLLGQRAAAAAPHVFSARTMFDVATLVSDAMRDVDRRDGPYVRGHVGSFNGSFILGGQIRGDDMRLFRLYAEGNFIEASSDTPFFQTGEAKYGKPIIDRVIMPDTTLADATKCVLISFDSTMRSNMSVGPPVDLACYERDSLRLDMRRRLAGDDAEFISIRNQWGAGALRLLRELPALKWNDPDALPVENRAIRPKAATARAVAAAATPAVPAPSPASKAESPPPVAARAVRTAPSAPVEPKADTPSKPPK